jgi:hypothetical protein
MAGDDVRCPRCGAPLLVPGEACPACLFRAGLMENTGSSASSHASADAEDQEPGDTMPEEIADRSVVGLVCQVDDPHPAFAELLQNPDRCRLPRKVQDASHGAVVIYAARPHVALAWRERDFPRSATRSRFQDQPYVEPRPR